MMFIIAKEVKRIGELSIKIALEIDLMKDKEIVIGENKI
jgi:hypothetical protein